MTVAQLLEALGKLPPEAVVLLDSGEGLSPVAQTALEYGGNPRKPGVEAKGLVNAWPSGSRGMPAF